MFAAVKSRFLPAVQLMRLPLVITAVSNTQAAMVLSNTHNHRDWTPVAALALLAMSAGLYSFGMVANDIVDLKRDRYLAPHRPLAAGRIGLQAAHLLAVALLLIGTIGGMVYAMICGGGLISAFFLVWTIVLIFFYNGMGKFVGAVGLLTLGLIRFFHAAVAQPHLSIVWHPLLLMDHVCILSAICYVLEGKRPRLSRGHWWTTGIILAALNVFFATGIALATWWKLRDDQNLMEAMGVTSSLLWPAIAVVVFAAFTAGTLLPLRQQQEMSNRQLFDRQRSTGRRLMVFGLVWLVIYDLAFVYGYF